MQRIIEGEVIAARQYAAGGHVLTIRTIVEQEVLSMGREDVRVDDLACFEVREHQDGVHPPLVLSAREVQPPGTRPRGPGLKTKA